MRHSPWLRPVYDPEKLRDTVYHISCEICELPTKPKFIAVRGVSGVSIGAAVSYYTGIPLVVVRKDSEQTHSNGTVQGLYELCGDYVIVDDLIDSGTTVRAIARELRADSDANKPLAVILYSDPRASSSIRIIDDAYIPVIALKELENANTQ